MRTPNLFIIAAMLMVYAAFAACKKYDFNGVRSPASVTIVHAMPTGNAMVPFFGKGPVQYFSTRVTVGYGSSLLFSPPVDSNDLLIVPITDTVFNVFKGTVPLVSGGIYSFFLAGDTTHPDTMLVKDDIPVYSDSSAGIRFVNLAAGGKSISINLVGSDPASQTEFSGLGYMHITSFKKYQAGSSVVDNSYSFEIHDQATGDLLTTYTWYYSRFKNNTIVIGGSTDPAGSIPLNVWSVNNY